LQKFTVGAFLRINKIFHEMILIKGNGRNGMVLQCCGQEWLSASWYVFAILFFLLGDF